MNRSNPQRLPRRLSCVALLVAALPVVTASPGFAQTPQSGAAASLCVYQDQGYSEGATICPQTRFMLMCSAEGSKLVWKPVADRSLASRCLRPSVVTDASQLLHRQRIARSLPSPAISPSAPPAAGTSAKCFVFNGKQYCE